MILKPESRSIIHIILFIYLKREKKLKPSTMTRRQTLQMESYLAKERTSHHPAFFYRFFLIYGYILVMDVAILGTFSRIELRNLFISSLVHTLYNPYNIGNHSNNTH